MKVSGTLGLILAGGAGRRMGGRDKAWLRWKGRPLICHAFERLAPQVDAVIVSANRHHWAYRRLGIEVVADRPAWRGQGPLAAIATVLTTVSPQRLAVVPVDAPCAPTDHVARLAMALGAGAPAAAVHDGLRRQPLFALLSGHLVDAAAAAVEHASPPPMHEWLDGLGATWIDLSSQQTAFVNINSPADLLRLQNTVDSCVPD